MPDLLSVKSHTNSFFESESYRLGDVLVDAGDRWEGFDKVKAVMLTHTHFDHIYGLNRLVEMNPEVKIYTNEYGREALGDTKKNMSRYHETPFVFQYPDKVIIVDDGQEIDLGDGLTAKAIFTPGHNPSCITWLIDDCLFTGDSYIPRLKTVTNLPGGDRQRTQESIERILSIIQNYTIYPGHKSPL